MNPSAQIAATSLINRVGSNLHKINPVLFARMCLCVANGRATKQELKVWVDDRIYDYDRRHGTETGMKYSALHKLLDEAEVVKFERGCIDTTE